MDNPFEINLLNVLNKRRVSHLPPHFQSVTFDLKGNEKSIVDWIYENLHGRFYSGNRIFTINNKNEMRYCVAFEEHSEATYFSLILSELNQKLSH